MANLESILKTVEWQNMASKMSIGDAESLTAQKNYTFQAVSIQFEYLDLGFTDYKWWHATRSPQLYAHSSEQCVLNQVKLNAAE